MHTIDLLRGQGIPAKTTLGSAAMVIIIAAVPILAAAGMVDRYMQNKTDIEIKQQAIETEQQTIEEHADALKFKESIENDREIINKKLSEVSSCLDNYIQWTPVLMTLVKNMPPKMVMSELRAETATDRKRSAGGGSSNRSKNVTITKRKLVLNISGSELGDYNREIESYSNRLKSSPELKPILEGIELKQNPSNTGDINTVSYTMIFEFKTGS